MTRKLDPEDRRQQRLRRLGTQNPRCATCGEPDSRTLELHHIAGRKNGDDLSVVCRNCHRKLSDNQLDRASSAFTKPISQLDAIGNFLLGLADLLLLAVDKLRECGAWLIEQAKRTAAT